MGGTLGKESVQYLTDVACAVEDPDEKLFASHLANYKKDLCTGPDRFRASLPFLRELVPSCVKTKRVRWLFHFCLQQLEHALCNYNQGFSDTFLVSIYITEFVVRYAHRVSRGEATQLFCIIMGEDSYDDNNGNLDMQWESSEGYKLCSTLMEFCTSVPVTSKTVEAHNGVINLLLSMTSSALYHTTIFNENYKDIFTEAILRSDRLTLFLSRLLERVVDWGAGRLPSSPFFYQDGVQWPVLNFWTLLGSRGKNNSISCGESLGRHCAQLLSVLIVYLKGIGHNPVLEFMKITEDGQPVPFQSLLTTIVSQLHVCPALCIILYIFIYDHPTFLYTTMTTCTREVLDVVQEVLHLSYIAAREVDYRGIVDNTTTDMCQVLINEEALTPRDIDNLMKSMTHFSYPFISFMTSTLLLLFSQDQVLNEHMNDAVIEPRFKLDYCVHKIPMTSLCVVVLTYGINRAMRERNETLAAVFIPCLSNLSSFIRHICPYASQKLVSLLTLTLRKLRRACELTALGGIVEGSVRDIVHGDDNVENQNELTAKMYVRQLFSLGEAVVGMLQGEDRYNDSLMYELLHKSEELKKDIVANSPCSHIVAAHEALTPLFRIIDFYETECASVTSTWSSEEILAIIRRASRERAGSNALLRISSPTTTMLKSAGHAPLKAQEIPFIYEESPQSYDFFGPFLWSTLLSDAIYPGGLLWATEVAALDIFPR